MRGTNGGCKPTTETEALYRSQMGTHDQLAVNFLLTNWSVFVEIVEGFVCGVIIFQDPDHCDDK